jgi:hypothetical protein
MAGEGIVECSPASFSISPLILDKPRPYLPVSKAGSLKTVVSHHQWHRYHTAQEPVPLPPRCYPQHNGSMVFRYWLETRIAVRWHCSAGCHLSTAVWLPVKSSYKAEPHRLVFLYKHTNMPCKDSVVQGPMILENNPVPFYR